MKKLFMVLTATVICGACLFTSCKKDEDLKIEEKIIGKWMSADVDGQPVLTDKDMVFDFISSTKAYISASRNSNSTFGLWSDRIEADVVISGNTVTVTFCHAEQSTSVHEFNITAINASEFTAHQKVTVTENGTVVRSFENTIRFVKQTADNSADILGTWQGHCTSAGSVFDDGQEHRWEYRADGNFVYYVKDGDNWVPSDNTLNQYFVAGNLLCTRWVDNGQENREWWEITIDGNQMHWTALREDANGQRFTATFEMSKVN